MCPTARRKGPRTAVAPARGPRCAPVSGSAVCRTKAYWAGTTCCSRTAMYRSAGPQGSRTGGWQEGCVWGWAEPWQQQHTAGPACGDVSSPCRRCGGRPSAPRRTCVGHALRAAAQPGAVGPLARPDLADGAPRAHPPRATLSPLGRRGDEAGGGRGRRQLSDKAGRWRQVGGNGGTQRCQRGRHLAAAAAAGLRGCGGEESR